MNLIDLHTHSTASDGSLTPEELVRYAAIKGLSAIALTDHDTMEGIARALGEGRRTGIEIIPGVEISVDFKKEMHILGYFICGNYSGMESVLADLRKNRHERNLKIIAKLNELGFDITMEEVEQEALGSLVARPHFARVMVKKGYAANIREAFDRYLASGMPAYVKKEKLTPSEGIGQINKNGGIPVLAHPKHLGLDDCELDELLDELAAAGLAGIEAYYVDNDEFETKKYIELASEHRLLVTGGSDFHGSFKPDIDIGKGYGNLSIPYEVLEALKKTCV